MNFERVGRWMATRGTARSEETTAMVTHHESLDFHVVLSWVLSRELAVPQESYGGSGRSGALRRRADRRTHETKRSLEMRSLPATDHDAQPRAETGSRSLPIERRPARTPIRPCA